MKHFEEEDIIVATEIVAYILEVEKEKGIIISLDQAYEDKAVSEEMRLTKKEIEEIISKFCQINNKKLNIKNAGS